MKTFVKRLTVLLAILAALGVIVLVSGLVPIKASSGHWPVTKWLLSFASSRSIATNSTSIEVPRLDEPGMVRLGGAIYESNCLWCHGRPSMPHPPAVAGMTPRPPYLPNVLDRWENDELFYIVQHGIKFAGMPAWPARKRDEEIWPVVAFLRQYADMSEQEFRDLLSVPADTVAPKIIMEACAVCHGVKGSHVVSERVPRLAGQNRTYLIETLEAYAAGERHSGIMEPIAARLSEDEMISIAKWYASQPLPSPDEAERRLSSASQREPETMVSSETSVATTSTQSAACGQCHGTNNDPAYPVLAGQPLSYLVSQLELLKTRRRGGTGRQELMHPIVDKMSEKEMKAASDEVSQLDELDCATFKAD